MSASFARFAVELIDKLDHSVAFRYVAANTHPDHLSITRSSIDPSFSPDQLYTLVPSTLLEEMRPHLVDDGCMQGA